MREPLTFSADAAIISRLGRELVSRQETALIELVKNAYDADAKTVKVIFVDDFGARHLEIVDDGSGMSESDLVAGFLRLASGNKVDTPRSPIYNRQRAGRKGIGRFATQRLGDKLIMTTRTDDKSPGLRLTVDWNDFKRGRDLTDVKISLEDVEPGDKGTTLRIEQLSDTWSDAQIRRCWRGVLSLQQPFPVRPVEDHPNSDPGFQAEFVRQDAFVDAEAEVANLQTEILDHMHATIEFRVDDEGQASWSMPRNRFGETRDWQLIHHTRRDEPTAEKYKSLRNTHMRAFYVILAPELLPKLVYSRIRDELSESGGIRLYRNGFRVVPYGDAGDDWLRLDEMYGKRSFLAPIQNKNFFGIIEISDPEGVYFDEQTSREGLIETPAFAELKVLASAVLVTAVARISEDRGRKTKAGSPTKGATDPSKPRASAAHEALAQASEAIHATTEAARQAAIEVNNESVQNVVAQAEEAARLIDATRVQVEEVEALLVDETAMLRFLASLGMTIAEFSHETGMTFDAFRLDFKRVFEVAHEAGKKDTGLREQANRAHAMLARLDTLTSYLNSLAAARSARNLSEVSLKRAVQDFKSGVELQARAQNIELQVEVPPFDPLYTRPMHEAEIASILLNFYTNAIKAIKRAKKARLIRVIADRPEADRTVRLRFFDSGDGIAPSLQERIFDAFFTTNSSPEAGASEVKHATGSGLGLWIVNQIVTNAGGEIFVGDSGEEFSTCIEVLLPAEDEDD